MLNPLHSSAHQKWETPPHIIDLAKSVLGPIDLDPATSSRANDTVRATRIITAEDDGLENPHLWLKMSATIWLNPPGNAQPNPSPSKSMAAAFWWRLMQFRDAGYLTHAIFLGFNLSIVKTTQGLGVSSVNSFPICFLKNRIRFLRDGVPGPAPSHDNCMIYVPGLIDATDRFIEVFTPLGECRR